MPKRVLRPQSVWNEKELREAFEQAGIKTSHIPKLYNHLVRHPDAAWSDVPELPRAAAALLEADFARATSRVARAQTSADGETAKLLVETQDGYQVEAVVMHYDTSGHCAVSEADSDTDSMVSRAVGGRRATLCVSSQVGCKMGCTFCATGTMGMIANLTAGEILEQLVHARRLAQIRNIVFMGMGEPLNNYEAVRAAVRAMTDPRAFGLRRAAVTVSTVGVTPRMLQMVDDLPGVSLALSLHAPTQALRQTIVPSATAYKLDKLMAALDTYLERSGQKVFVEYVMLAGVNDGPQQAAEAGALLAGRAVTLNLIPWNPVYSPGIAFAAPEPERVAAFQRIVREQYGVQCTIRQEKGQDIAGACGQLAVEQAGGGGCAGGGGSGPGRPGGRVRDIEELGSRLAIGSVA